MVDSKICFNGAVVLVLSVLVLSGCASKATSDPKLLAEFNTAGPLMPELDYNKLRRSQAVAEKYLINPGDVLKVQMPWELRQMTVVNTAERASLDSIFLARIGDDGSIVLPVIGKVMAADKTLQQLEADVIDLFYPKYTNVIPTIVITVERLKTNRVTISGAVNMPGVYELPANRTSLISVIMEAGGIIQTGASVIRITYPEDVTVKSSIPAQQRVDYNYRISLASDESSAGVLKVGVYRFDELLEQAAINVSEPVEVAAFSRVIAEKYEGLDEDVLIEILTASKAGDSVYVSDYAASSPDAPDYVLLPIKGLNNPFTDIALVEGCMVEVLPLNPQIFTVMGLVNRSGAFAYPPNVRYNLLQGLSMAGGTDMAAKPKYARIYRKKSNGDVIDVTFEISGTGPFTASNVEIKPGDVIAIDPTFATSFNQFIATVFRVNIGTYYDLNND